MLEDVDDTLIMQGAELREKFVGTVLWDIFDFITFGVFEKKKSKEDQEKAE